MKEKRAGFSGLNGAALKYIAMASMFLDHIGAVVLEYLLYYPGGKFFFAAAAEPSVIEFLIRLNTGLRMAGRLAFPLYCFLLTEGFLHTSSRIKYLMRLLSFAVLSEVPFDLAAANMLFYPEYQNVFFDLAAALATLWGVERAETLWNQGKKYAPFLFGTILLAGGITAELFRADYGATGVLFAVLFYGFRKKRLSQALAGGVLGFWETLQITKGAGVFCAVPIVLYNGKKGKQRFKYLFYGFYPVHLLLLFLIRWGIFQIPVR